MPQRERYEWSNLWWDVADDTTLPRVLLIGDSISVGYGPPVTAALAERYHVDRMSTSHALGDGLLAQQTRMMLTDRVYAAVHFNNGLHGWHLDAAEYRQGLADWLAQIGELAGDAKLVWAASTPITVTDDPATLHPDNNPVVLARNAIAAEVMASAGVPINDLYAAVIGRAELRSPDGYHYLAAGYDVLGEAVTQALRSRLERDLCHC